ncbi:MAG: MarR family transcriptional regulator, partial [Clostridia bacterium]|nr:MarR family transcriptional regulator [Clostridia bacterium]
MSTERELARRLNLASYSIDYAYYLNEQRHGIKTSEMCLLYALDDGQMHSQNDICLQWEIPRSTLNTIIKQWERQGYLRLTPIPGKSREMHISLTEAGLAPQTAVSVTAGSNGTVTSSVKKATSGAYYYATEGAVKGEAP